MKMLLNCKIILHWPLTIVLHRIQKNAYALKPFLKNAANTVMVTDDMIQNHEKHFFTEAVLVNAIIDQIMNSGFWCKEHDKLMKIEKGIW